MKKALPILAVICMIAFISCKKTQSSWNCVCTYTPENTSSGLQTKTESNTVKATTEIDALGQCSNFEDKYFGQYFGNCNIQ